MAMDSQDGDRFQQLYDSVNYSRNDKIDPDIGSNVSNAGCCSVYSSLTSPAVTRLPIGSSRRKWATLFKGITIEEFLASRNKVIQLTAIDKLILKNKAALADDQMKRARVKNKDKVSVKPKNEEKKSRKRLLNTKVLSTKLKHTTSNGTGSTRPKTNGLTNKTNATKDTSENLKKLKNDKRDERKKKKVSEGKGVKVKEKDPTSRKMIVKGVVKVKKDGKYSRSADGKICKNKMAYRTRSINNERLRNGKARIIKGAIEELPSDFAKRKGARAKENILKRPIKQERSEDEPREKKQKTSQGTARKRALMGHPVNDDIVKKEVINEPRPDIVEINVETEEFLMDCDIKSEPTSSITDEVPVPNGLYDIHSLIDYDTIGTKSPAENNDDLICLSSNEEDNSDWISLQAHNEVIVIDEDDEAEDSQSQKPSNAVKSASNSTAIPIKNNQFHSQIIQNGNVKKDDSARDNIFSALGLQSIGKQPKPSEKEDTEKESKKTNESIENSYRGSLKMVIKTDNGCRRMEMKNKASSVDNVHAPLENIISFYSKLQSQNKLENGVADITINSTKGSGIESSQESSSMSSLFLEQNNDVEIMKNSNPQVPLVTSINETAIADDESCATVENGVNKANAIEPLVVPEKSSSFTIHPNRLCYDVCKYCFGKFGTLDTPCHVGQLRDQERQNKILECEPNLKIDTCLCDACFRFVTRKAIRPPKRKTMRPSLIRKKVLCDVQNCNQSAIKLYGKRKWRSKLCRKIAALSFDIRKKENGSTLALCNQHFLMLSMFTLCGICKKRLNRNDMFSIRTQLNELNEILKSDGIPVTLVDNMLLCRYCHHCMSLRLNYGDPSNMSSSNREYYEAFKREILHCLDGHSMETTNTTKLIGCDTLSTALVNKDASELTNGDHQLKSVNSVPAKSQFTKILNLANIKATTSIPNERPTNRITVEFGDTASSALLSSNSSEKKNETELPLKADFSFEERANSSSSWERCVSTIQFDAGTKKLWQDLQKPYGNQSSFIRHLIMLEKYWRNGSLVLSDTADAAAVKYINSVKNRIESLETSSTLKITPQRPPTYESTPPALTLIPPPLQPAPKTLPVETNVRPPSAPPPLLKLNCLSSPFLVRKSTPICAVKPSSDSSSRTQMKPNLPQPPKLERIFDRNVFVDNKAAAPSLNEMQNFRYKPVMRKLPPPLVSNNAPRRSPFYEMFQLQSSKASQVEPSQPILFPKLPKALTIIQMNDMSKNRKDDTPALVRAPFMVGEKPSVSVFRDMSK